jgi:hypothetical protein
MSLARPFTKPTATTAPRPLGDLILAWVSAASEEGKATGHWQEGGGSLEAIQVCTKKALEAEKAMWRRLREVCPEEIGTEAAS